MVVSIFTFNGGEMSKVIRNVTPRACARTLACLLAMSVLVGCNDSGDTPDVNVDNGGNQTVACTDGQTQEVACGLNGQGVQSQVCADGAWADDGDCENADVCQNDSKHIVPCGRNGQGEQKLTCEDGQWENTGDCAEDPDVCVNGDTWAVLCGLNNRGQQAKTCTDGQWVDDGDCVTDETCEDGAEQEVACGLHDAGTQSQICAAGAWENNGACADPDACLLDDDTNPRCEAGIVRGASIKLLTTKFWHSKTTNADEPPALEYVTAEQFSLADENGNPVHFETEEETNAVVLTMAYTEDANGTRYEILRGNYHYTITDDQGETLQEGWIRLRSSHVEEKQFVVGGLSIDVDDSAGGERHTIAMSREDGTVLEPINVEQGADGVRQDYIVLSNTWYALDVSETPDGDYGIQKYIFSPSSRWVHYDSKPAVVVPFKVTKGADFGAFVKGGYQNAYNRYQTYHMQKDGNQSDADADYDYYTVHVKKNEQFHIEATIPGEKVKLGRLFKFSSAPADPVVIDLDDIDPADVGMNDFMEASLYTSAAASGVVRLFTQSTGSQVFTLDIFRVWQAMNGFVFNYFVAPDYDIHIVGDQNITVNRIGAPGRYRYNIEPQSDGVSVVTIAYAPIRIVQPNGTTTDFFNAIAPENLGTIVVNVGEQNVDNVDFGIDDDIYDVYYFDRAKADHADLTFTPTAETDVVICVHAPLSVSSWDDDWTCPDANADGSFTVGLKEGRNILRAQSENSTIYRVEQGRGLDITIENKTQPGAPLAAGDTAEITMIGLRTPVSKMATIYNPGFGKVYMQYDLDGDVIKSTGSQYYIATQGNTLEVELPDPGEFTLNSGRIHSIHFGSPLGSHRALLPNGKIMSVPVPPEGKREFFGTLPEVELSVQ